MADVAQRNSSATIRALPKSEIDKGVTTPIKSHLTLISVACSESDTTQESPCIFLHVAL